MTDLSPGELPGPPASPSAAPLAAPAPPAAADPAPPPPVTVVAPPPAAAPPPVAAVLATRAGSWFAGLDPRGWRITVVVAVLMVGTVFGANLVNAVVPLPKTTAAVDPGPAVPANPNPNPGQPTAAPVAPQPVTPGAAIEVGAGVTVYPPGGWSVVGSQSGQVVLQKGGAVIVVLGVAWTASATDLVTAYRDEFLKTGTFTANDPQSLQVGNGIPAAGFQYTGVLEGSQVDGAMVAGATGRSGVIVNVIAASGGLQGISDDVNHVLGTLKIAGGG